MCGICGKIAFQGESIRENLLAKMASTIVHRGPDNTRIYAKGHVGLAQCRLSIVGLGDEGNPPLHNEDYSASIVFNGEVYNFKEIRAVLAGKGYQFYTETDTEVVLRAYEAYGIDCLKHFNGMFAFAIWDERKQQLFAARDRIGKKPFFYAHSDKSIIFGSEAKAILADTEHVFDADLIAIDAYLREGYVPSPLSAFEGIKKLSPGSYLICDMNGGITVEKYWSPPTETDLYTDYNQTKELLRLTFYDCVKRRMVADVPIGAFLSGGLDSGVIVATMAEISSKPVKTFSIGFEEAEYDELPYARQVVERYNTDHHEFIVKMDSIDVIQKLVHHYNEPFADPSSLPMYYVSKLTSDHLKVALTGDGGDESLAGYNRYRIISDCFAKSEKFKSILPPLELARSLLFKLPHNKIFSRLERGIGLLTLPLPDRYRIFMGQGLKPAEKSWIYSDAFRQVVKQSQYSDPMLGQAYSDEIDPIAWMMRDDQRYYLPDDLQVKADIASMANSLELRSPMLDYQFVEFCAKVPSSWKLRGGKGKYIFKDTFGHLLPEVVLNKSKSGFGIPLGNWLKTGWKDMLRDVLLSQQAKSRGLFNHKVVEIMIVDHIEGRRNWGNRLWMLLWLELWFVEFIDS